MWAKINSLFLKLFLVFVFYQASRKATDYFAFWTVMVMCWGEGHFSVILPQHFVGTLGLKGDVSLWSGRGNFLLPLKGCLLCSKITFWNLHCECLIFLGLDHKAVRVSHLLFLSFCWKFKMSFGSHVFDMLKFAVCWLVAVLCQLNQSRKEWQEFMVLALIKEGDKRTLGTCLSAQSVAAAACSAAA